MRNVIIRTILVNSFMALALLNGEDTSGGSFKPKSLNLFRLEEKVSIIKIKKFKRKKMRWKKV